MSRIKLILPEFLKQEMIGKNMIVRSIQPSIEVELISTELEYVFLKSKDDKTFCIQSAGIPLDKSEVPILTTEGAPDIDRIIAGEQKVYWAWHPSEDFDAEQIRKSWVNGLSFREEIQEPDLKQSGLRTPQLGAIYAALAHWAISDSIATVVMPTGTGKTETMLRISHRSPHYRSHTDYPIALHCVHIFQEKSHLTYSLIPKCMVHNCHRE